MNKPIANVLRRIAQMIVIDDTPETEEELLLRRRRLQQSPGEVSEETVTVSAPRVQVQRDETERTQRPKLRPMRRQPDCKSEWKGEGGKEHRNQYQAEYRANGNDVGTRYVKKPKV